ncbi:MAG: hypothetical protein QXT53_06430 [Ignisphaera sp.]
MYVGKYIRLHRILNPDTEKALIVALDHGGYGMVEGLEDIFGIVKAVVRGGADALILQLGIIKRVYKEIAGRVGIIARVTALSLFNRDRGLIEAHTYGVETAASFGADAVIASLYVGGKYESTSIEAVSRICDSADRCGIPCVVEVFPSLDRFKSFDDPEGVLRAVRIAIELGADMVKAYLPPDTKFMMEVVRASANTPIVLAGGEAASPIDVLRLAKIAVEAGLSGIAFGRKIFKSKDPEKLVKALREIIHRGASVEDTAKMLQ